MSNKRALTLATYVVAGVISGVVVVSFGQALLSAYPWATAISAIALFMAMALYRNRRWSRGDTSW